MTGDITTTTEGQTFSQAFPPSFPSRPPSPPSFLHPQSQNRDVPGPHPLDGDGTGHADEPQAVDTFLTFPETPEMPSSSSVPGSNIPFPSPFVAPTQAFNGTQLSSTFPSGSAPDSQAQSQLLAPSQPPASLPTFSQHSSASLSFQPSQDLVQRRHSNEFLAPSFSTPITHKTRTITTTSPTFMLESPSRLSFPAGEVPRTPPQDG